MSIAMGSLKTTIPASMATRHLARMPGLVSRMRTTSAVMTIIAASASRNTRSQSMGPLAVLASPMILDAVDGSTNPTANAMTIIRMSNGLPFSSYVDSSIALDCLMVKKPCLWLAVLMDNSRVVLMGTGWANYRCLAQPDWMLVVRQWRILRS